MITHVPYHGACVIIIIIINIYKAKPLTMNTDADVDFVPVMTKPVQEL